MVKKNFLKSSLVIAIAVVMMLPIIPTISLAAVETDKPVFTYKAHVQTDGWQENVVSSTTLAEKATTFAGTSGESKRVEGLNIRFASTDENVTVTYRAHVQTDGWQDPKTAKNGETVFIGTEGQCKRVEAIKISVKGLTAYRVLYRAHVQGIGWQNWVDASSDDFAGTEGLAKRIEALEIAVVPEDSIKYTPAQNGTHLVRYNGKTVSTQKCASGAWTQNLNVTEQTGNATDTFTRECQLCGGNKEKTTLTKLLADSLKYNGDGVVRVGDLDLDKLYEKVTVAAGNTLVIEGNLAGHFPNNNKVSVPEVGGSEGAKPIITNKGKVILTGTIAANFNDAYIVNVDNGTTVWDHVFTAANELETSAVKDSSETKVVHDFLTEIKLADGSVEQTLTKTITNKGNLTIKNGTLKSTHDSWLIDSTDANAKLTLENVKLVANASAIKSNGKLTVNGGSITANGATSKCVTITSSAANSAFLTNVDMTSKYIGVALSGDTAILTITGGKIDVTGTSGFTIYSEAKVGNLIVKDTKMTSENLGIYLANNYGTAGNLAILTNVTITSKKTCLSANQKGDRFQVDGGSYTMTDGNYVINLGPSTTSSSSFKNCTLTGEVPIYAPHNNYTFTNVI